MAEEEAGVREDTPMEVEQIKENPVEVEKEPLSKSAQKKLLRKQREVAKRAKKKAEMKEIKEKEKQRKRLEWEEKLSTLSEEEKLRLIEYRMQDRTERMGKKTEEKAKKIKRLTHGKLHGQNLVIDLEFSHLMTPAEIKSLSQQIMYCYAVNSKCPSPAHLWLTGSTGDMDAKLNQVPGFQKWIIEKETTSYIEALQDRKDKLVYLTADAETVLDDLDCHDIYIIGGLVDRNRWKGITLKKAQEQGIRTARLPIDSYMKLSSSQVLTVNQVVEILLKYLVTRNWKTSFFDVIPQRKMCEAETGENGSEAEDKESEDKNISSEGQKKTDTPEIDITSIVSAPQKWEVKKAKRKAQMKELKEKEKELKEKEKENERKRLEWEEKLSMMSEEEKLQLIEYKICKKTERMAKRMEEQEIKRLTQGKLHGQNVVIDLEFFHLMTPSEISCLFQQIIYCYFANSRCSSPAHLWLTGSTGDMDANLNKISGFDKWIIEKETTSYIEVFKDRKDKLVYLTADAETVLDDLESHDIYIIGGLVDRDRCKGVTLKKAQEQGIRTARLPIESYLTRSSSQALHVNFVVEILLKYLVTRNWDTSFFQVIPRRKRRCEAETDENGIEAEDKESEDKNISSQGQKKIKISSEADDGANEPLQNGRVDEEEADTPEKDTTSTVSAPQNDHVDEKEADTPEKDTTSTVSAPRG